MSPTNLDIKPEQLQPIFAAYPTVVAAWLFGSTARQTRRPQSDIDIGVLFTAPPPFDTLLDLSVALQSRLTSAEVDLVSLNQANPILRFEAVCGRLLYCADLEQRIEFVSLTAREYEDSMAMVKRYWPLGTDLHAG